MSNKNKLQAMKDTAMEAQAKDISLCGEKDTDYLQQLSEEDLEKAAGGSPVIVVRPGEREMRNDSAEKCRNFSRRSTSSDGIMLCTSCSYCCDWRGDERSVNTVALCKCVTR